MLSSCDIARLDMKGENLGRVLGVKAGRERIGPCFLEEDVRSIMHMKS